MVWPTLGSRTVKEQNGTDALGYISVAESLGISSTTFTQCALIATKFAEITQNNGHYAV